MSAHKKWHTFWENDVSEWFHGYLKIAEDCTQGVRRWLCPKDECPGEMVYTGFRWMTASPGYHHECTHCGYMAAIRDAKYPTSPPTPPGPPGPHGPYEIRNITVTHDVPTWLADRTAE